MNRIAKIFCLLLVACFALSANAKKSEEADSAATKNKAQYVFLEALHKRTLGEYDSYVELLRHAYALDASNTTIAHHLGYSMLLSGSKDRNVMLRGINLMHLHFLAHPEEYYESAIYGSVCNKLGLKKEALEVWEKLFSLYPNKPDVMANLAETHADNGNFDKAIALYDTIESREGQSVPITIRKINYRMAMQDSVGCIQEAKRLLTSAPSNVDFNLLVGNVHLQFAQNDSALHYFNRAHEIEPDNGYVYLYKADYYKMQGDSVNYDLQIYNALINKNIGVEQKVDILTDYVRNELSEGVQQSERIDNLFSVLIEQHPHESEIHELYSQYLGTVKDYAGAAEQLSYVLDLEPTNAEKWQQLVLLQLLCEDFDALFASAEKAIEYNPNNTSLYKYIASAYMQIKEYDKAFDTYHTAFEKCDSTDFVERSEIVTAIGDTYAASGDTIQAFVEYEKAIDMYQGNLMAMNNYAYFLAVTDGDLNKAEKMSATTVKYEPENPTYLDTYAWVFFKKGEYALALTYMKSAMNYSELKKEAPSAELYEHLGDALFMNGHHEEAVGNWEKALELNPDSEILQRKVKHRTFFFK